MPKNKQLTLVRASYKKLSTHQQAFRDSRRALIDKIWNHGLPKWDSLIINGTNIKPQKASAKEKKFSHR